MTAATDNLDKAVANIHYETFKLRTFINEIANGLTTSTDPKITISNWIRGAQKIMDEVYSKE